jgi:glycosyltransferase involved in cell wall biosynthesis
MQDIKLSILIPSTFDRDKMTSLLVDNLKNQVSDLGVQDQVEILTDYDNKEVSIGTKRQRMLTASTGTYVVYIDSDDQVSCEYVGLIVNAIASNPDCVGITGSMTTNGLNRSTWEISKDLPYDQIKKQKGIFHYRRFTNHLSPVKREIAIKIGFNDKTFGEDYDYALRLKNSKLLKTEVKIDKSIYHYDYWQK